jgi:hypothetical protein
MMTFEEDTSMHMLKITIILLTAILASSAFAEEPSNLWGWGASGIPTTYYDAYLGDAKDNVDALSWMTVDYLSSNNYNERLKAYLAIMRLQDLPPEQAIEALGQLSVWIGVPYEPVHLYMDLPQPHVQREKYPADKTVIKFGKAATDFLLRLYGGGVNTPGGAEQSERQMLEHRAEVLAAIEGREKAEELLREKWHSLSDETLCENVAISIAALRVRKGLPLEAETPRDKFEQELKRVKEELSKEPTTTEQGQATTPAKTETPQPFPWYLVLIGCVIVVLGVGLVVLHKRKR